MDQYEVCLYQNEGDASADGPVASKKAKKSSAISAAAPFVQDTANMDTAFEELNVFGQLSLDDKEEVEAAATAAVPAPINPFWNFDTLVPMWPNADFSQHCTDNNNDNGDWADNGADALDENYVSEEDEAIEESNRSDSTAQDGDDGDRCGQLGRLEEAAENLNWDAGSNDEDMDQESYDVEQEDGKTYYVAPGADGAGDKSKSN